MAKKGYSSQQERKRLLQIANKLYPLRGFYLLADREYVGRDWFAFWDELGLLFIPKAALSNIGPEDPKIDPIARSTRRTKGIRAESRPTKRNRMILSYTVENDGKKVILLGINEQKDSIYVVLNRYERNYALSRSTLEAGVYE